MHKTSRCSCKLVGYFSEPSHALRECRRKFSPLNSKYVCWKLVVARRDPSELYACAGTFSARTFSAAGFAVYCVSPTIARVYACMCKRQNVNGKSHSRSVPVS